MSTSYSPQRQCCESTHINWPKTSVGLIIPSSVKQNEQLQGKQELYSDVSKIIENLNPNENSNPNENLAAAYSNATNQTNQDQKEVRIPSAPYWLILMTVNTYPQLIQEPTHDNAWTALCPRIVDDANIWDIVQKQTTFNI